jgi:hypothetical protein
LHIRHPNPASASTIRYRVQVPTLNKVKLSENNRDSEGTEVGIGLSDGKMKERVGFDEHENNSDPNVTADTSKNSEAPLGLTQPTRLDPDEYHHARKKLRRALLEHYQWVLTLLLGYNIDYGQIFDIAAVLRS